MSAAETYKRTKKMGDGTAAACRAVMREHGLTAAEAAQLSWVVETGASAPRWLNDDGSQTQHARAWDRGAERALVGDDE